MTEFRYFLVMHMSGIKISAFIYLCHKAGGGEAEEFGWGGSSNVLKGKVGMVKISEGRKGGY